MIRIAPLITADVDNATLPGGKASVLHKIFSRC